MSDGLKGSIDTSRFNRALRQYRSFSKKGGDAQKALTDVARNFVRRVIALTPPASGKANTEARKRGEATIAADLARIISPAPQDFIDRFIDFYGGREQKASFGHKGAAALGFVYNRALTRGEMPAWHEDRRRKDGRVSRVNRNATTGLRRRDLRALDMGLVEVKTYEWFRKRVQKRVGLLASGWNQAAAKLGYRPPSWIRRHGEGRGDVQIVVRGGVFYVRIANKVKFVGSVKGLQRRVQAALNQQAQALEKRVGFYLQRTGRSAGFR